MSDSQEDTLPISSGNRPSGSSHDEQGLIARWGRRRSGTLNPRLGRRPRSWAGRPLAELAERPWLGGILAGAILSVLLAIVFRHQLFGGWSFPWDFDGAYSASPAFVGASVGNGHFLSWSPYVASGFPVDIDPQSGIYFPVWWLLGALRIPLTIGAVTDVQVFHVLFGAIGMFALARARRIEWAWAMVAGVAYLFFGGFYGQAEHADFFRGFAYLPWLLWALTPPADDHRWTRLVALPPLTWLIVSGAYPAQPVSFGITAVVYVAVALTIDARPWRSFLVPLALAAAASVAVGLAVLLPYLHAQGTNELVRVLQPTAAIRAGESISFQDFFGLYLNSFAWAFDGTEVAWAVAIPMLIGLVCAGVSNLRRHAPLVACGIVGLLLAMTPKIGFVGKAMASLSILFPSRFPASDYKPVVATAIIIVAAQSWADLAARRSWPRWRAALATCAVIAGVLVAPSVYAPPTRAVWLVIAVAAATLAAVVARPRRSVLVPLLVLLVVIDGSREMNDYRFLGKMSSWDTPPAALAPVRARDATVRLLPGRLEHPPASRPARVAPTVPVATAPIGSNADANGWTGDGYHLVDYGGTIERPLWDAEHDAALEAKLLAPWHAYTFPCATVQCGGRITLPSPNTWTVSNDVHTTSYGAGEIVYRVHTTRPELMVENELAIPGWQTNARQVRLVNTGLPLRGWRLAPGSYQFTATYQQPGRLTQLGAIALALLAWLGCGIALRRQRRAVAGSDV